MLLSYQEIMDINSIAIDNGLHERRAEMMVGIDLKYVGGLATNSAPAGQQLLDLSKMNQDEAIDSCVPLERWLRNAAYTTSFKQKATSFFTAKADKALRNGGRLAEQPDIAPERFLIYPGGDLLPFDFLAGASRTGAGVARLLVPRLQGGQPASFPGSGQPIRYWGTGWLIGPRHLITNHHVINARNDGEAPAEESDFKQQGIRTEIQFDYDRDSAQVQAIGVSGVVASNRLLDYALLELKGPVERAPLTLRLGPLVLGEHERFAVNIIQHPGGAPKQIAMRNNLVARLQGNDIAYFTDTAGGSSGSPVCDDKWQVVALHKASTRSLGTNSYLGKDSIWINIGTAIDPIIADLRAHHPDLWMRIGSNLN